MEQAENSEVSNTNDTAQSIPQENVLHETEEASDSTVDSGRPRYEHYKSHPGYKPVDISDLPEDKQKVLDQRFDYFFRQIKDMERKDRARENALREYREIAAMQSQKINDLTSGVGQIVDHIETRSFGESEEQIKGAMKEAFENGDMKRFVDEQARLIEVQTKKLTLQKRAEKQKEPAQKEVHQQAQQQFENEAYTDAVAVAAEAIASGELPHEKIGYVEAWQGEKDAQGNLIRPWAFNPGGRVPTPGSPHDVAWREFASIVNSPTYASMPIERQLVELDRRMGVKQMNGSQNVMGGNLTRPHKTNTIKLSPDTERLAVRMKFGGPKAKSDADHIKAYRDQIAKVKQGSR